ncbi:MAG: prolyl oligopeptidase family serine peptidase, partial [Salinibacter sp.]|uniref:prolyl oligopeptidase family serine peptidase n=1 Tax=Salinibacter sp. TaxID=2065818 RepID=UPI002FC366E9
MRTCALALLTILLAAPAHGQSADGPWTLDHVLTQRSLTDVDIGPDGDRVLWVKETPDPEADTEQSDVYLTYRDDPHGGDATATLQLTRTGDNRDPRWGPEGEHIAFVSSRETENDDGGGTQLWRLDPRGGAPEAITAVEHGVQDARWLDAERLLFTAREQSTRYEEHLEATEDDADVIEDTTLFRPVRLFTVHVETGDVTRVTENDHQIEEFAPSPNGQYVVYSLADSPISADARNQPHQFLLDLETGTTTELFAEQYFDPSNFQWTADGDGFYATDSYSSDPEHEGAGITKLYHYDLDARDYQEVPLDWGDKGVGYGGYTVVDGGVHVQLADGPTFEPRFYRKTSDGWTLEEVADERFEHASSFTAGPDGETIVFSHSTADTPPSYRVGTYRDGQVQSDETLTTLNEGLDDLPIPRAEVVTWTGANGDTVNGILHYPLDYDPDRAYPMMTVIHGGPSGVDLDAWSLGWTVYAPLLAQRDAFVFRPNYHGSGHHGLDFVESIKGRYYELEVPDIVSGIDSLANAGTVDRDSLGVMGWSNGAILTTQLTIEHPELFQVAAPGAGDVNWTSDYGNCAFGVRFDRSYFKGAPWEYTEHYIQKSPLFEMPKVQTPTLIHHGTEDRAVPYEQGWEYYRALQQIGNAPVRFLSYPGEPHGLGELSHQRRKMEEDLKWIDTYLFGETSMEERVEERLLANDAPLSLLESAGAPAETDGHYGTRVNGTLVPETVTLGDTLTVGRFEVTRAQFRAFDSSYDVPEGTADHPANNLSADRAQAYVDWLSEQTGQNYRLPTADELAALKNARSGPDENTPAHWAGFTPTPDESRALRARLDQHPTDALLMPVGSRPPGHGNDGAGPLLYDVDGNVAEWARTDDGLQPENASALTLTDPKAENAPDVPRRVTGLRVVLDR